MKARERALDVIARKYLNAQADRIAKEVRKAPSLGMINQWGILDREKEAGLFADATMPWYVDSFKRAINSGLAAGKGEIFEGEAKETIFTPEHEARLKKMILESGTKISETSMLEVMDYLELAESQGLTVTDLAKMVETQMKGEFNRMRAMRIARTEAAKVENYGELEGYRETEFVELKGWLCASVELSRFGHKEADDNYSTEPIGLDDDFMVRSGEADDLKPMAHPGDPKGGAGNVINCLCTIFPQVKET